MDRAYAEPLNVDALARVALMSRSHFIREFRRVFAETPYRYLQRRRVERAMFLLRHGANTVTEVCDAVGFTSLGTFSRTFSGIVGTSPTAYRDALRGHEQHAPTSFAMRWTRPAENGRGPDRGSSSG
jgi:AraC-like DNA-binding protein